MLKFERSGGTEEKFLTNDLGKFITGKIFEISPVPRQHPEQDDQTGKTNRVKNKKFQLSCPIGNENTKKKEPSAKTKPNSCSLLK